MVGSVYFEATFALLIVLNTFVMAVEARPQIRYHVIIIIVIVIVIIIIIIIIIINSLFLHYYYYYYYYYEYPCH